MTDERRQFNRVEFNSPAIFHVNDTQIDCQIIDLSLNGTFIKLPNPVSVEIGETYLLTVSLGDIKDAISITLKLMHHQQNKLGLMCSYIDLDSITHLRRLVELNLGDSSLLERDFHALVSDNQSD